MVRTTCTSFRMGYMLSRFSRTLQFQKRLDSLLFSIWTCKISSTRPACMFSMARAKISVRMVYEWDSSAQTTRVLWNQFLVLGRCSQFINYGYLLTWAAFSIFSWSPHILQDFWARMLEDQQWLDKFMAQKRLSC